MKNNRKNKLVAIAIMLVFISLGYAYLTANLKITGTANIGTSSWDIHFANPLVTGVSPTVTYPTVTVTTQTTSTTASGVVVYSNVTTTSNSSGIPEIKGAANQDVEFEVNLNQPGDYYNFTVDIVNGGGIAAELDNIASTIKIDDGTEQVLSESTLPPYLEFSYAPVTESEPISPLAAGVTRKLAVHLGMKADVTNDQYATALGKKVVIKMSLNYIQQGVSQ